MHGQRSQRRSPTRGAAAGVFGFGRVAELATVGALLVVFLLMWLAAPRAPNVMVPEDHAERHGDAGQEAGKRNPADVRLEGHRPPPNWRGARDRRARLPRAPTTEPGRDEQSPQPRPRATMPPKHIRHHVPQLTLPDASDVRKGFAVMAVRAAQGGYLGLQAGTSASLVESMLSLAEAAADTDDGPAANATALKAHARRLRQYHRNGRRCLAAQGAAADSAPGSLRWLAIGDSITQGITPAVLRPRNARRRTAGHPAGGLCGYLPALHRRIARGCRAVTEHLTPPEAGEQRPTPDQAAKAYVETMALPAVWGGNAVATVPPALPVPGHAAGAFEAVRQGGSTGTWALDTVVAHPHFAAVGAAGSGAGPSAKTMPPVCVNFVGETTEAFLGPYNATMCTPAPRHNALWGVQAIRVVNDPQYDTPATLPFSQPNPAGPGGRPRHSLGHYGRRVYDWVRGRRPHVVSLLIGVNDVMRGGAPWGSFDAVTVMALQALRGAEDAVEDRRRKEAAAAAERKQDGTKLGQGDVDAEGQARRAAEDAARTRAREGEWARCPALVLIATPLPVHPQGKAAGARHLRDDVTDLARQLLRAKVTAKERLRRHREGPGVRTDPDVDGPAAAQPPSPSAAAGNATAGLTAQLQAVLKLGVAGEVWLSPCVHAVRVGQDLDPEDAAAIYDGIHPTMGGEEVVAADLGDAVCGAP